MDPQKSATKRREFFSCSFVQTANKDCETTYSAGGHICHHMVTVLWYFVLCGKYRYQGEQRRMISVVNIFVFFILLFLALLLLYVTKCTIWKLCFTFLMC